VKWPPSGAAISAFTPFAVRGVVGAVGDAHTSCARNGNVPQATTMTLQALHAARWRVSLILTAAVIIIYFGFVLLIAFDRGFMGRLIVPGLSVGILLGVVVIVASWLLTWVYVRWANDHYDAKLKALRDEAGSRE
jgi:uncharacterized membrane protein (DUF485 family)